MRPSASLIRKRSSSLPFAPSLCMENEPHNHCVLGTPDCASLLVVPRVSGALTQSVISHLLP